MNTWYFKIEGRSKANEEINVPFGFFVNCIIATDDDVETTKDCIIQDLNQDGLENINILVFGKFEDFYWDEIEIQNELSELAKEANRNNDMIFYSAFHTWEEKRR